MDRDGVWQPPTDWPEDYPPIAGWQRDETNRWQPPALTTAEPTIAAPNRGVDGGDADVLGTADLDDEVIDLRVSQGPPVAEPTRPRLPMSSYRANPVSNGGSATATIERPEAAEKSLQAKADIRAMLLVGGAIGLALVLLVAAFVLQSRAGAAEPEATAPVEQAPPEVIFAAETDAVREQRRQEARLIAPGVAREQLVALPLRSLGDADLEIPVFDSSLWVASAEDCLDLSEQVLVARSAVPIVWADNLQCVASEGAWVDPYLGIDLNRTLEAEVRSLVPLENVHLSGGSEWTPATRARFVGDVDHPATLAILAAGGGHNPRNAGPDVWRPSNEASWCGYAVDWVAVKARWQLSVSAAESGALNEMLDTCGQAESSGPHASSMVIDPIESPAIEFVGTVE